MIDISLRDYFAAKAMQGLVSATDENGTWTALWDSDVAVEAYRIADEMLEIREKEIKR